MATRIRPADPADAAALSAIACASKAHWGYAGAQIEVWREQLTVSPAAIAAGHAHVAEHGATPAGFYLLAPAAGTWSLEHFWVLPAYMGRGIGRALLTHATALAAGAGGSAIAIDADPHAEAFYLACGATRVGSVAAPIDGAPERTRPQLQLDLVTTRRRSREPAAGRPNPPSHRSHKSP